MADQTGIRGAIVVEAYEEDKILTVVVQPVVFTQTKDNFEVVGGRELLKFPAGTSVDEVDAFVKQNFSDFQIPPDKPPEDERVEKEEFLGKDLLEEKPVTPE